MNKLTGGSSKPKDHAKFGEGPKFIDYKLNWKYDSLEIDYGSQHIYHLLLTDHEILTSETDCFAIKTTGKNSNITISLNDAQLDKKDFELDSNQLEAIRTALESSISLIIGPPGTGKTHTATILSMILSNQILKSQSRDNKKLLIVAQSNTGVDNLADKLAEYGVNVTRVTGHRWLDNEKNLKACDLSKKLKKEVKDEKNLKGLSCIELIETLKFSLKKLKTEERLSFKPCVREGS